MIWPASVSALVVPTRTVTGGLSGARGATLARPGGAATVAAGASDAPRAGPGAVAGAPPPVQAATSSAHSTAAVGTTPNRGRIPLTSSGRARSAAWAALHAHRP